MWNFEEARSYIAQVSRLGSEGEIILSADLGVVLAECGSDMNDTGTIRHGYVVVAYDIVSGSLLTCDLSCGALEEGLVSASFKSRAGHFLEDRVGNLALLCKRREHLIEQSLCHVIGVAVDAGYLAVGVLGVDTKCNV